MFRPLSGGEDHECQVGSRWGFLLQKYIAFLLNVTKWQNITDASVPRTLTYSAFLFLVDGSYGKWTTSPCSATCGEGVEIRIRQCDNPPGKYGGNCSKQGPPQEIRTCKENLVKVGLPLMVITVMIIIFGKIGRIHKAKQQHMVFSQKLSDSGGRGRGEIGCQHITYDHLS
jgi:hypothetical protein